MTQFNLQSLFQSDPAAQELGLGFASQMKQENELKLAQALQQQQHQAKLNPLMLEQQRLSNETAQAQLPGFQAQSGQKQLELKGNQDRYEGSLNLFKEQLKTKLSDEQMAQLSNQAQQLSMLGHAAKMGQIPLEMSLGLPPQLQGMLKNPELMIRIGDSMLAASKERQSQREKETMQGQSAKDVAAIGAGGGIQRTAMEIDAGKFDRQREIEKTMIKSLSGSYQEQYGALMWFAEQAAQEAANLHASGDPQGGARQKYLISQANTYAQMAEQARRNGVAQAAAQAAETNRGRPNPGGFGIPTVNQGPSLVPQASDPNAPAPQGAGGGMKFENADSVKSAYSSGKITKEEALKILRSQFGMQ